MSSGSHATGQATERSPAGQSGEQGGASQKHTQQHAQLPGASLASNVTAVPGTVAPSGAPSLAQLAGGRVLDRQDIILVIALPLAFLATFMSGFLVATRQPGAVRQPKL